MKANKTFSILFLYVFISFITALSWPSISWTDQNEHAASDISTLLLQLGKKAAAIKSIKTEFVQEKNLALFKNKLVLKGRIYLQKPHRIAWYVDNPVKYKVIITDKTVRQWDEDTDEITEISLTGNNIFGNVISQLTVWFFGDYLSLLKDYDVRVKTRDPYVLEFFPKEENIAKKVINSITITFREDTRYLKRIEFREISGDSTVINLKNTLLNGTLDENDFRISPLKTSNISSLSPTVALLSASQARQLF